MIYSELKKVTGFPRMPLEGSLDLTYRCNLDCRHCWLRMPDTPEEKVRELAPDGIVRIVEEARAMGCRIWSLSGGEPMLRPDFTEIFRYVTRRSAAYTLNTNGTLITPKIARLLKKKGMKMVALYGATAKIHDLITRTPGSFESAMQGMSYLREANAGFIVQIVPMKDNYDQMKKMVRLAQSLSPIYRIGAPWLYPRADRNFERNEEIFRQRLDPREIVERADRDYFLEETGADDCKSLREGRGLFDGCISSKRDFHVDAYGQASFCSFVKDPALRYDLVKGHVRPFWEEFVPGLAGKVKGGRKYGESCGACDLRADCSWCPVYGYLEHRSYTAKVDYLCSMARENRKARRSRESANVRHYGIGGMTIRVGSDLPITDKTFIPALKSFEVDKPGDDLISIKHAFSVPAFDRESRGEEIYRKVPWVIYRRKESWLYLGISSRRGREKIHQAALFNNDHSRGIVFNDGDGPYRRGGHHSLTLFPTDQILLARVLADRDGCYIHASGVVLGGKGLLFAGHSEAGKSTISKMLKDGGEILCDDRIIVRRWPGGFRIHGTWSHGELPDVSPKSAPLNAILFLRKAGENRLETVEDPGGKVRALLACLIKPLVTVDWWEKTLSVAERIAREVPCYHLHFDRSGRVVEILKKL